MLERLGQVLYILGVITALLMLVPAFMSFASITFYGSYMTYIPEFYLAIAIAVWGIGWALRYILSGKK